MMQNFDPKLFDSYNVDRNDLKTATGRGIGKTRPIDESSRDRKKFTLKEADEKSSDESEEAENDELPSAFNLVSGTPSSKRKKGVLSKQNQEEFGSLLSGKQGDQPTQGVHSPLPSPFETRLQTEGVMTTPRGDLAKLEELMKILVHSMSQLKQEGKNETIITLKHSPLFAGAEIKVTSFDTAHGEYNITFSNLTQEAKHLIDQQTAQESLLKYLQERGHVVHILVATTNKEDSFNPQKDVAQRDKEKGEGEEQKDRRDQEGDQEE